MAWCRTGMTSLLVIKMVLVTVSSKGCYIVEGDICIEEPNVQLHSSESGPVPMPWKDGIVPVYIDTPIAQDVRFRQNVSTALNTVKDLSQGCVTFPNKSSGQPGYINITRVQEGCYGSVGFKGGQQIINLGSRCGEVGIIMHEILHALGFWHEHSRTDRDYYVKIHWGNIIPGKQDQFKIRSDTKDLAENTRYDWLSIMHYKYDEFSVLPGELPTITQNVGSMSGTKTGSRVDQSMLGQRTYLTAEDVNKIRWFYGCNGARCKKPGLHHLLNKNTTVKPYYTEGDRIHFACEEDHKLLGANYADCKSDETWSGALPICVPSQDSPNLWYTSFDTSQYLRQVWSQGWTVGQVPESEAAGPQSDNTYGNPEGPGAFYYIRPGPTNNYLYVHGLGTGDNKSISMVFFYSMYGSNTVNITVQLIFMHGWQGRWHFPALWSRYGSSDSLSWNCQHITGIEKHLETEKANQYLIDISAKVDSTSGSTNEDTIVAIDDVMIGNAKYVDEFARLQNCGIEPVKPSEYDSYMRKEGMKIK